jgi:hypothetical protein
VAGDLGASYIPAIFASLPLPHTHSFSYRYITQRIMAPKVILWSLWASVAMAVGSAEELSQKEKYRDACPDYRQYSMYGQ